MHQRTPNVSHRFQLSTRDVIAAAQQPTVVASVTTDTMDDTKRPRTNETSDPFAPNCCHASNRRSACVIVRLQPGPQTTAESTKAKASNFASADDSKNCQSDVAGVHFRILKKYIECKKGRAIDGCKNSRGTSPHKMANPIVMPARCPVHDTRGNTSCKKTN